MAVEKLNRRHGRIKLPKLGWVKFRASRSLDGELIRSATLTRQGRHWFLSVLVDDGRQTPTAHQVPGSAVGVDRGVAVALATSGGVLLDQPFVTPGERRRTAALQRKLSRCAERSTNRDKTRAALEAMRARERRRRLDFVAQSAHQLTAANAVVMLEDLKTKQMTKSAKGTLERPGLNVKAKSGLNRAILGKGWHQFALALTSAARYTGTTVVTVPAAYTSQRCSACGHVDPKSRESQAVFRCTHCTHHEHADVNAAKNILAAGLAVTACQDPLGPRAQRGHRSRNQQETARNYCPNPPPLHPQHDRLESPGFSRGEEVNSVRPGLKRTDTENGC